MATGDGQAAVLSVFTAKDNEHTRAGLLFKSARLLLPLDRHGRRANLEALYVPTEAATEEFNLLKREFVAAGSEIETVAREWICDEFCFVASAYGFTEADAEELTAGRDW
ncbi:DUF5713 family protein [Streptomyces sp. NPDC059639]|uniref:DUF5713 family protein n=1 Tax=Streptomyces sp. NPDC059639 TaxID=3346891 RepID=UPI0036877178